MKYYDMLLCTLLLLYNSFSPIASNVRSSMSCHDSNPFLTVFRMKVNFYFASFNIFVTYVLCVCHRREIKDIKQVSVK